jgi:uncharacterized membrane protein HdeD (DUF308 family)
MIPRRQRHDLGAGSEVSSVPFLDMSLLEDAVRPAWKRKGSVMVVLGIVLLIVGFLTKVAIIWTLGVVLIVVGALLALLGGVGRSVGGRRHWY